MNKELRFVIVIVVLGWLCLMPLSGCGNGRDSEELGGKGQDPAYREAREGQQIFQDRSFGGLPIACADCHADYPDDLRQDSRILPGHSLLGAAQRTSTWAGEFTGDQGKPAALGAARCAMLYMDRGSSINDAINSREAESLVAFFSYISTGTEIPLLEWRALAWPGMKEFQQDEFSERVAVIYETAGSAEKGAELFRAACWFCHSRTDSRLGPSLAAIRRRADEIPRVVRSGKKSMPFFSTDKLSDRDVADILAYVRASK